MQVVDCYLCGIEIFAVSNTPSSMARDWTWFMRAININQSDLVLKGPRIEGFEADILKISKLGYTIEYEIKISRGDFFIDALKSRWVGSDGEPPRYFDAPIHRVIKHDLLQSGATVNKFYYVVPDGLVGVDEVPSYAGLIFTKQEFFQVVKTAPWLSNVCRLKMYQEYRNRRRNG